MRSPNGSEPAADTFAETQLAQAAEAFAKQQFQQAETILRKLHESHAGYTRRSTLLLGRALESQKNYLGAADAYDSHLDFAEDANERAAILSRVADLLYLSGNRTREVLDRIRKYLEASLALCTGKAQEHIRRKLCAVCLANQNFRELVRHANDFERHTMEPQVIEWLLSAYYALDEKDSGKTLLTALLRNKRAVSNNNPKGLLSWLIKFGMLAEAQTILDEISYQQGTDLPISRLQAEIHCLADRHEQALMLLTESFIREQGAGVETVRLHAFRGQSLRALGRHQEAQRSFAAMNTLSRSLYNESRDHDYVPAYLALDLTKLRQVTVNEDLPYEPVFMVGFPRSGTTLLDTVLVSQPGIATLSEKNGVGFAIGRLRKTGRHYPQGLSSASSEDIIRMRKAYFSQNRRYLPEDQDFDIVIDKLPLNIIHIPLISTLFPRAKFILSLRHPLDVCISCYQQPFALNEEMIHFTELRRCFERYAAVMGLFERFRAELELDIHTVKYESLVSDFESEGRKIFRALAYKENDDFLRFYEFNKNRIIDTPSSGQVTREIYTSSSNRWVSYRSEIEPFIPLVKRFIDDYGYTV